MPSTWTDITKPAVGDPTKKQGFADKVVDDLTFLKAQLDSFFGTREIIKNGSFENDADADSVPDGWDRTLYTNGTFAIETAAPIHGAKAIKFTRVLGGGNGGGYVQSADYFEVTENRPVIVRWQHKCSAAGLKDKVEVFWFDKAKAALGTPSTTIYDSTANPTSWTVQIGGAMPPANARFAKLRITGGFTDTDVAGDSFFDDVSVITQKQFDRKTEFTAASTSTWIAPVTGLAKVTCIGGGGAGGGANGSGGGGAGGVAIGYFYAVAGTGYTVVVGAGGAGVASADGNNGTNSTFNTTTVIGNGGVKSVGATGGAGGGGTGNIVFAGEAGDNGSGGNTGGRGGHTFGAGGASSTTSTANAGGSPGGGGGGIGSPPGTGGAGAAGAVIIEY